MDVILTYLAKESGKRLRALRLTVMSEDEGQKGVGLAVRRRMRLARLVSEAHRQGGKLTYSDLSLIMLASRATLKRDVCYLRNTGLDLSIGRNDRQEKA